MTAEASMARPAGPASITELIFAAQGLLLETGGRKCPDSARASWDRLYDVLEAFDPEDWMPHPIPRTYCELCGSRFRPGRAKGGRRFCSDRCRWTNAKRDQRARERTVRVYP